MRSHKQGRQVRCAVPLADAARGGWTASGSTRRPAADRPALAPPLWSRGARATHAVSGERAGGRACSGLGLGSTGLQPVQAPQYRPHLSPEAEGQRLGGLVEGEDEAVPCASRGQAAACGGWDALEAGTDRPMTHGRRRTGTDACMFALCRVFAHTMFRSITFTRQRLVACRPPPPCLHTRFWLSVAGKAQGSLTFYAALIALVLWQQPPARPGARVRGVAQAFAATLHPSQPQPPNHLARARHTAAQCCPPPPPPCDLLRL